jgi:hypothetical protein
MKKTFILLALTILVSIISFAKLPQNKNIDPTGTYLLDNQAIVIERETYGYAGVILINTLPGNKILMTFRINKGAPGYAGGSFVDTLDYNNNKAVYTNHAIDASCQITFSFSENGVNVKEKTANPNAGCGFGKGVVADGFYKKVSSVKPILRNPVTGDELK